MGGKRGLHVSMRQGVQLINDRSGQRRIHGWHGAVACSEMVRCVVWVHAARRRA